MHHTIQPVRMYLCIFESFGILHLGVEFRIHSILARTWTMIIARRAIIRSTLSRNQREDNLIIIADHILRFRASFSFMHDVVVSRESKKPRKSCRSPPGFWRHVGASDLFFDNETEKMPQKAVIPIHSTIIGINMNCDVFFFPFSHFSITPFQPKRLATYIPTYILNKPISPSQTPRRNQISSPLPLPLLLLHHIQTVTRIRQHPLHRYHPL